MVRAYRFVSLGERDVEQWLEHTALCRLEGGGAMVGAYRFVSLGGTLSNGYSMPLCVA